MLKTFFPEASAEPVMLDENPANQLEYILYTLQETNISHLGKRKIIFKSVLGLVMLVPRRVDIYIYMHNLIK